MKKILYKTNQNNPTIKAYKEAIEKGMQNHHVLPRGDEWIVKKAGSSRASQVFSTQKEAANYGKLVAQNNGTALFIHRSDGKIRERKDY
ncbi:MAG: DUF2188 domain-containing protein [Candidatus Daviesbacteria bacterium]|nr:DUF2188 domain-containing protein [Candidatus Daviesbacteria bacterium]